MMKRIHLNIILLLSITSIASAHIFDKFSLDGVYSLFGKYTHEEVIEKEFQLEHPGTLSVSNIAGNITITTEWKRNTICLKAIKKTAKPELLEMITLKAQQSNNHDLILASIFAQESLKGALEFQLIVPSDMKLNLSTDNGNIIIQDVNGQVIATTLNGNIDIKNTTNNITAKTENNGHITITHAKGNVIASTQKGDIMITDATQSVVATTQKGNIITACSEVPATSRIVLNAEQSGGITLSLPAEVNATLQGKTTKGSLTSEHYVTVKPFTTRLDKNFHKQFKQTVNGFIGTGEADIRLTSNNGNIKILETKTA